MTRIIALWATLLSALALHASAQLLSCTDIDCPTENGLARCNIDNTTLTKLGVANFSSSLSPTPLTWTVGLAPEVFTDSTDQRRYYLGTPPELDLRTRTDITGCALFFTGIEASLTFPGMDLLQELTADTCADALSSACVTELTNQALNIVANSISSNNAQCSDIAQSLQSSPPLSCTQGGTWGNITAKTIAGSDAPPVLPLDGCNPTTNATYNLRSIATFPRLGDEQFSSNITPLMTIFAANGNATNVMASPEVHLNCMMPMQDFQQSPLVPEGSGQALAVWKSFTSVAVALVGFLAMNLSYL